MFELINPVAVLVAGITSYVIGMLWYSPILFMKPWLEGLNKTEEDVKRPEAYKTKYYMFGLMTYTLLVSLTLAFVLAVFIKLSNVNSLIEILGLSMLTCFGFIVTVKFTDMLYTLESPHWGKRAQKLFFVQAGYYVAMFLAMGFILFYFQ